MQYNYTTGFIVNNSGDTLKGLIDNRSWRKNPESIQFKTNAESPTISYSPIDIRAFAIDGGSYYESRTLDIDHTPYRLNDLAYNDAPVIRRETVFLQVLIKNNLSLFYLYDADAKTHFFVEKKGITIQELVLKRVLKNEGGKLFLQELDEYKGQLIKFITDCSELQSQLSALAFNTKALTKFVMDYNACSTEQNPSNYVQRSEKFQLQLGILAGYSFTKPKFISDSYIGLTNSDFEVSSDPYFGIALNIVPPWNRRRWGLYNEFAYRAYSSQGSYIENKGEGLQTSFDNEFELSYIRFNTFLRYQMTDLKFYPFFQIGIGNGFLLKEKNVQVRVTQRFNMMDTEVLPMLKDIRGNEQALLFGAGVGWKRLNIELRFETGNGISFYNDLGTPTRSLFLIANYRLF